MSNTKRLKLWRSFSEGGRNFRRNGLLSVATVLLQGIALFLFSFALVVSLTTSRYFDHLKSQLPLIVSIKEDTPEATIQEMKATLERAKEVKSVEYVNQDENLKRFLEKNKGEKIIEDAVKTFEENPLFGTLNITAYDPADYDTMVAALRSATFASYIERINYESEGSKRSFSEMEGTIRTVERVSFILGIVFACIAFLITYNALRLTIYSQHQEFEIKRLVGASNLYVKMPLYAEAILYALGASILAFVLLIIAILALGGTKPAPFLEGGSLWMFFLVRSWSYFGFIFLVAAIISMLSSSLAVRKYLKI